MRCAFITLLFRSCLALSLVCAHAVLVLHECHHLMQRATHPDQVPQGSNACAKCIGLAPLHGALANPGATLPDLPDYPAQFAETRYAYSPPVIVPFHAQAPPTPFAAIA